ncbi:hypothetical protein ACFQXA_05615 [Nocardiopsis composta]
MLRPAPPDRIRCPVWCRKTSSRLGLVTVTACTCTSRAAQSRGTRAAPSPLRTSTPPVLGVSAATPSRSRSARAAARSSPVRSSIRSAPTAVLRPAGVPSATMRPASMIAIRSHSSASSR